MPKKKSYKIKINFDEKVESLSGIFGLTEEERDKVMTRFQDNVKFINQINPKFHIAHVIEAAAKASETDSEFAYLMFRVGREHEQQNMAQAANFAEKLFHGKKAIN